MTLDKVQLAIGHMIAELPPLASLSIKRGDRFWDIRVEIKPEAEPAPDTKKKKPSPSRLRRNQRRLRMLLERSKTTGPEEPDLAGTKVTDAGELPVSTGVNLTPVSQPDGPALSTLKTREDVNTQIPPPTPNSEGEGTDDDSHNDDSNSEEDGRDMEEEEPRSPSVTSTSLPSMDVATMDMTPKDAVLNMQANKAIRVPANVVDNTVKTRRYVTVKRKARKKHDPNSCKTV